MTNADTPRPFRPIFVQSGDEPKELPTEPPLVLVVDDDDDTRESLSEVLRDSGYAVISAEDGQQAFDYLAHRPVPDCVVLDLWMPNMDGWSLAAEVMRGRLPSVPIAVVTAAAAQFAYPVPARQVLRKPVNPARLVTLVADLVKGSRGEPQ
jgi:CheY-like chemotaxis protein